MELLGAVVGFVLLGLWIDRHWATTPWGVVSCLALGLIGGLYNFIRQSLRALNPPGKPDPKPKAEPDG